jgi:hypothetical protein
MFVRCLGVLLAALVVAIGGCGGSDNGTTSTGTSPQATRDTTKQIAGVWTGRLIQHGLAPFRVAVTIGQDGTGMVAYTGIDCAGSWKAIGHLDSSPALYLFEERINQGAGNECKGSGTVEIHPTSGALHLEYRFHGGGVTSTGVLSHATLGEVQAIWKEAGVNPPS